MSATTERLIEQIHLVEEAIKAAESRGEDSNSLRTDLQYYQRKLSACNEALTEGRQIIKG
jgi:hypothetical protein